MDNQFSITVNINKITSVYPVILSFVEQHNLDVFTVNQIMYFIGHAISESGFLMQHTAINLNKRFMAQK